MTPDHLSTTFAALADPTRRAILARLSLGELSVTELAEPFEMSMPAVSKHLKVLERAGLIARSREAQWRRCRLDAAPLREVSDWLEGYRSFWEQSLERLDAYLTQLQTQTEPQEPQKPQMTQPQMAQMTQGRKAKRKASSKKGRPRGRAD
ncbi:MAG: helix-turn-helix transcriptional regulator [Acidobacteria bacterium]|nr:helix-turn-helix transcriptional regulator [Acidobacteriota bacterium]